MSVELMHECNKKLQSCLNKADKLFELFSTSGIQKQLYDTCKSQSNVKETRETINKLNQDYENNILRIRELMQQGI